MNAYSQYQQNQVLSASPEQILLMLYDGAIRFTRQAIYGLEEENLALFHHGIKKTLAIITEFSNSLDHAIGGEIAEGLDALYNFMIKELTLANLYKDIEKLRVVDGLLTDLRATWGEAVEINRGQISAEKLIAHTNKMSHADSSNAYVPFSVSR